IRLVAAQSLAGMGKELPKEAVPALLKAIDDPDPDVQSEVIEALKNAASHSPEAIVGLVKAASPHYEVELFLVNLGRPAVKPLVDALNSDKKSYRPMIYSILRQMGKEAKE